MNALWGRGGAHRKSWLRVYELAVLNEKATLTFGIGKPFSSTTKTITRCSSNDPGSVRRALTRRKAPFAVGVAGEGFDLLPHGKKSLGDVLTGVAECPGDYIHFASLHGDRLF